MEKFSMIGSKEEVMETIEVFAQHEYETELDMVGNNWSDVSNDNE